MVWYGTYGGIGRLRAESDSSRLSREVQRDDQSHHLSGISLIPPRPIICSSPARVNAIVS